MNAFNDHNYDGRTGTSDASPVPAAVNTPAPVRTPTLPSDTMQVLVELGSILGRIKKRMDTEGYEVVEGRVIHRSERKNI